MPSLPELLSPAGSIETFWAGFQAGADAFYLGAEEFNARRRAKNFSRDQIRDVVLFSHRHGRKVYCTLNTLVFDAEMPRLVNLLELLEEVTVDAVIVQDLGVIDLIRRHFPGLKMHASTQMFCHNSQQARFLRDLGISRIVFPRELSVDEMSAIMTAVPLEYEAFIHGAMCFSFSGCCLFSSHLFGASGNRGECRQPCRYPFEVRGATKYPFSMRDMQTAEVLPRILQRLPLTSLKIEGRLKNAAYVEQTVAMYRRVLDSLHSGREIRDQAPIQGQRESTPGYYFGNDYRVLVNDAAPGTIGEEVGRVTKIAGLCIEIRLTQPVRKGDRLNLQSPQGKRVLEATLLDFARTGDRILWTVKEPITDRRARPGDLRVFRTGNSAPEDPSRRIRKEASMVKTVPIEVTAAYDQTRGVLRIGARLTGMHGAPEFAFEALLSLSTDPKLAWPAGAIEEILRQVDTAPFDVRTVVLAWPEGQWCRLAAIKDARRRFYAELSTWHQRLVGEHRAAREKSIGTDCAELQRLHQSEGTLSRICYVNGPGAGDDSHADRMVLDAGLTTSPPLPPSDRLVLRLPVFVSESLLPEWRAQVHALLTAGYCNWMAPVYGWIPVLRDLGAETIFAGPYLYAVNSFAVRLIEDAGARLFVTSPDIPEESLGPVARFAGRVIPLNPPREVCITRLDVPEGEYRMRGAALRVAREGEFCVVSMASPSAPPAPPTPPTPPTPPGTID